MAEIKQDSAKIETPKRVLQIGGLYEHFKGGIYQVLEEAQHSETGETLVIYTSQKDGHICARPKDMFLSEVDRNKYPDTTQKYRFEYIENQEITFAALKHIDDLADKATPGDWFATCDSALNLVVNSVINGRIEVKICSFEKADIRDREANADFISRVNPAKVKKLVSTIREQEKQLKEYFFKVRDYGHATDSLVCFLFELCEIFQPGYSNDYSSDLEARIFLRKEVKRLKEENARLKGEVHDWSSSCKELAKDLRRQEKEANWLAQELAKFCSRADCDECEYVGQQWEENTFCKVLSLGVNSPDTWREAARKAVEAECKSN